MKRSKSKQTVGERAESSSNAQQLREYVQGALNSRAKGAQSPAYNNFVKELQALRRKLESAPDDAAEFSLVCLITALKACVMHLKEGKHDAVLTTVLSIPLWTATPAVREAVLQLVVQMVVASMTFIPHCLQVMIFNLLPPPGSPLLAPDSPGETWSVPPAAVEVQGDVIAAIERGVQLVPVLPTRLLPMLLSNLPHKLRDRATQCLYMRALICLCQGRVGAPLREQLLSGIVEHLLSIDSDIRWEEIVDQPTGCDQEEAESEDEQDDIFELEGMGELDINGLSHHHHASAAAAAAAAAAGGAGEQFAALQDGFHDPSAFAAAAGGGGHGRGRGQQAAAAGGGARARPAVDETADKLDSLMELVFEHLQWRVDDGQLAPAWQTLLATFERTLLHAHRSKFTQYLIFFLALKDPQRCCSSFSACLLSLLRDGRQPPITRSAGAAYLASFLARCAPAPRELVVDVLQKLTGSCVEYAAAALQQQQQQGNGSAAGSVLLGGRSSSSSSSAVVLGGKGGGSGSSGAAAAVVQRHQAFYATVQGLLYLLCYHMQPLLGQQQQQQGEPQQQHQQLAAALAALVQQQVLPLLSHPLAPLAVCHQAVAHEFVRQVQLLGLADDAWELAALEAVSQHRAAVAAAASAASAVVIGGSGSAGDCAVAKALRPLEVFFPFDPYLLRRSSRFLQLPAAYTCFSHGHPHVAGDAAAAAAAATGGSSSEEEGGDDDTTEDDEDDSDVLANEADLLQRAAAAAGGVAGSLEQQQRKRPSAADSDDGSSSSSSEDEEEDDDQLAAALGPGSAAAGAAAGNGRLLGSRHGSMRQQRGLSGLLPLGLAAGGRGGSPAGPSPPPDMMATSLTAAAAAPYLTAGISYSPGAGGVGLFGGGPGSSMGGMSPVFDGLEGMIGQHHHRHGASPPALGGSPMQFTPYEGAGFMSSLPAQLHQSAAAAAARAAAAAGSGMAQ